jgi:hypothetical protein
MQRRWVRAQIRVPHLPIEMFFAVLQAAVDIKTSVANRALDDRQSLRLIRHLPVTTRPRHIAPCATCCGSPIIATMSTSTSAARAMLSPSWRGARIAFAPLLRSTSRRRPDSSRAP